MGDWDAIVFSEVLAYLTAHEAIGEVRRYAEALSPAGVVAVSMINDGKSRAIWRALRPQSFDGSTAFSGSKRSRGPPTGSA